jgi:transketolase
MEECEKNIIDDIEKKAFQIRCRILELSLKAGKNGAHIGGSLSTVELYTVLYYSILKRNVVHIGERDRLIVSKGHSALAHYCVLESIGLLTKEETDRFESNGSSYYAHAKRNIDNGIEFSGGSLGLGISYAVGVALGCKSQGFNNHIYVLVGDGECDEGQVWEAAMSAANFKLENFTVIVDYNGLQSDGFTEDVMNLGSLKDKFNSFGFETMEFNGHSVKELLFAFNHRSNNCPNAFIAKTIKGKGVTFMENERIWHHNVLTEILYQQAIEELSQNYYGNKNGV